MSKNSIKIIVALATLGLLVMAMPVATAASKSINCYKGSLVKKVTSAKPVCAKGWSLTKPKPKPKPVPTAATKQSATVQLSASYKGKMSLLWSDSGVQASAVTATSSLATAGLTQLTGSGSSSPSSQCESISGAGVLSDGTNTIKLNFDSTTKGCAAESSAPTSVAITGTATVIGGTGKYAHASGNLKVTGTFSIQSSQAGFSEQTPLAIVLAGSIYNK